MGNGQTEAMFVALGVVLLELLSGNRALISDKNAGTSSLLTDWAWSLVKDGRAFDVVEYNMPMF